jgi:DNA-binding phage protein
MSKINETVEKYLGEAKSKEASAVLQLMDKDFEYQEALAKVVKSSGVNKKALEKELNKYI